MLHNFSLQPSIINHYVAELRDIKIQVDSLRFRQNLERIGMLMAYEISKEIPLEDKDVETPLGTSASRVVTKPPVLATILRAGLPLHHGFLKVFDHAENAFVSAYRKHDSAGNFGIELEYVSSPSLEGKTLIVADPMLATGASMIQAIEGLLKLGKPESIHIAVAIAAQAGIDAVQAALPQAIIWAADVDEELNNKAYIVPGLGDAGDLAFGQKLQR